MRKVINAKLYDTETAKFVGKYEYSIPGDFNYFSEELYRKKTGEFFLHGEGGPKSKYREEIGLNEWESGEKIIPLKEDQVKKWIEEHLSAEEYEKFFDPIDEDKIITTSITLSPEGQKALRTLKEQHPTLNKSAIIESLILEKVKE